MTADSSPRNLVLTGFMGAGKTTVGREVALRLGRPFIEMDAEIARRAGKSIPEIFREDGEETFRQMERDLCRELAAREGVVIATGGGALIDEENRRALAGNGCLICLDCEPRELLQRLQHDDGRPMLWADDRAERVRELLQARRPAYARIPYHVDTTHRSKEQVVDDVIRIYMADPIIWQVRTPGGEYPVHLMPGGLAHLGALLAAHGIGRNVVVVSDEHVWPLHGRRIQEGLQAGGYSATPIILPPGEQHKTPEMVSSLYDRFLDAGLDRSGAVIAMGGGVITDMAGLAASTFMRGVPLVPVPTTLLGMVDASVGGKVAVDLPRGKNLVGAFVEPLMVMLDPETLNTLPDIERRAGLAEIIKAGVIADPALFAALEEGEPPLRQQVQRALQVKIAVVEEDPYERGRRAVLNLGHTFAHAFEVLGDYRLHHGLAVSIGMAAAAHLAHARGLCSADTLRRIIATLQRHNLPVTYGEHDPAAVYRAMGSDKKRRGNTLRFILPRDIGAVMIADDVSEGEVIAALERIHP
ncbi:MAG: 3-dehydroquinate synthase [Anaerolineae bacterium]|jgi:shikimate kinase/3-dehydroquinate synthase